MDTLELFNIPRSHPYLSDFLAFCLPTRLERLMIHGHTSPWSKELSISLAKRNIYQVLIYQGVLEKSKSAVNNIDMINA
jgi:hypothetical protein